MSNLSKKQVSLIHFAVIAVIMAVVIAANVVAGVLFDFITIGLQGANIVATDFAKADELCQDMAGEGAVLLKNENNALPLKVEEGTKIPVNVFGWTSSDGGFISGGSGSSAGNIDPAKKKSFLQGLEEEGFECNSELVDLYKNFRAARANTNSLSGSENFFTIYEPDSSYYGNDLMSRALDFSDTAIIVISRLGGEGQDLPRRQTIGNSSSSTSYDESRTYLELSVNEENMINTVSNAGFAKVIVVLNTCNVFECGFIDDDGIDAALSIGAVGQSGAVAVAQLLNGKRTPSGKTVDTYPYALESDPSYANSGRDQAKFSDSAGSGNNSYYVDYVESIYVGYRYYETAAEEGYINYDEVVQYPFGYGLSYTSFEWEVISVSPSDGSTLTSDGTISVDLRVINTGDVAGQDVVELYFTAPYTAGGIEKAHVELAAFAKTSVLAAGDAETISLSFNVRDMSSYDCYDANGNGFTGYEMDGGDYVVSLRTNSHEVASCEDAEITYKVPASGFCYETDDVTGTEIENRFTGVEATDNGISLDGTTSNANIPYMTRADFESSFPKSRQANRARGYSVASDWVPTQKNTTEEVTFGESGDLSLTLDGGKEMNEELIFELGKPENWESDTWNQLLNQITLNEVSLLVRDAGYQTEAMASIGKLRHHDLDGPSGFNTTNQTLFDSTGTYFTAYPVETVLAQSWNAKMSYAYGLGLGVEASAGISGLYAPGVNIHRNAFDGRNFEYYSEDPMLSGVMGAETVKGAMANGLYCYVKHFAANESETRREGVCTFLTEQAMREIYCRPFEICVKQGKANAIMSSFNYIGGTWAGASYALLTEILREEWGFKGSVISDWCPNDLRGYMSINQGIRAGNDCWLAGAHGIGANYISNVNATNEAGTTTRACLREAAKNMIYTYCNTMYEHKHHDSSADQFVANVTTKGAREQFPYWILAVVAIDVIALVGCGFWAFKTLKNLRKEENEAK